MVLYGFVIGVLVAVLGVAIAFDVRARRHRGLSAEYQESGRLSSRRAAAKQQADQARTRPTRMNGPPDGMSGPSLGP